METLRVIVSGGKDHYGAWIEGIKGIYGVGDSLEDVKEDIKTAISIFCEENENIPEVLKENYKLEFIFDASGLIRYYSQYITLPAMEKITGVNQKQLWHYANGYKVPRKDTASKISSNLKEFGKKLENEEVII